MSRYDTEEMLQRYLLFHYGADKEVLPYSFGPRNALHFPVRCVTECVDLSVLPKQASVLEIGCAVGRSSFELSKYCDKVIALDHSDRFIQAAQHIQQHGSLNYQINGTGTYVAKLPEDAKPDRVRFLCADVMKGIPNGQYDLVMAANVLCRVPHPLQFLQLVSCCVKKGGQLILVSPYSWLEEFTPKEQWLVEPALKQIETILSPTLSLVRHFEMPFLLREHARKYEWCVAQASMWVR